MPRVVIYLKFTSNHNTKHFDMIYIIVVIYLKFTSNHNRTVFMP